jgi:hypothetical protein
MANKHPTLHDFIVAFATDANETGGARSHFEVTVDHEPVGPEVPGTVPVLTIWPRGFEYLAHKFGIEGNALATPEQVEGKKQFMRNEARAANEAAAEEARKKSADGVVSARIGGAQ